MRDYGKVHSTFWISPTTRSLSDDGRMLALYLLTCQHNTISGVFRLPDGYVCDDIQWDSKRVSKGFTELFENGFANRCGTTKWVWIRKHFDWNPLENPNQRKAATKQANIIPAECAWKAEFIEVCEQFLDSATLIKPNPFETLPEPFRNQDQEQEQEQESKSALPREPSPKKTKTAKTGLPEGFSLDPELSQYVTEHLPDSDPAGVCESFTGKAAAKGWQYVNWRKAFQEFVRNAMPNSGHFSAGQYPRKVIPIRKPDADLPEELRNQRWM